MRPHSENQIGIGSFTHILKFSGDMFDIVCSISFPVISFCYWGACTSNSTGTVVIRVYAQFEYLHNDMSYSRIHAIFAVKSWSPDSTQLSILLGLPPLPWDYWNLHQSYYSDHDVHILPLASQRELFIALEVLYLLTIRSPKHRLFAVRSGLERTGGKWHVGRRLAMKLS